MAYFGNDLQVAFPSYKAIDSISSSFNGVLKTFPLRVGGLAPVPFPVNAYQCLISVNNVVLAPDPTGTVGFNLVGTNIVFATAPTGGQSFFGVILAGADYVTVGAQFPDGTVSAPSITFENDSDTGFYRYGANEIGIAVGGVLAGTIKSGGITQTFAAGTEASPSIAFTSDLTTGFYSPGANQIALSLGGTKKFSFDSSSNGIFEGSVYIRSANSLRFYNSANTNYLGFKAATALGTSVTWTLPSADGTANTYLKTDGAGTLSFGSLPTGSTSTVGILQLTDSTSSTSTTTAATPNSVKTVYDLVVSGGANLPLTGGTLTGNLTLNAQSDVRWADADSSNWVAFQAPATVTNNVTWTLPSVDGSTGQALTTNGGGTLSWSSLGNVFLSSNNDFTGANTFYNNTGQTFGRATSTNDGIVLQGRAGGTTSLRAILVPGTLTANRTITLPDVTGTVVVTGSTGTVSNTMLTSSSITVNGTGISLGNSGTITANTTNALTINNSGSGAASGSTFDGSVARTISYNSIGAAGTGTSNTFTGAQIINGNLTLNAQGELRFADFDSSNYVSFRSPATVASDVTWTLPAADGTANQALVTNGSGVLSFLSFLSGVSIRTFTSGTSATYTPTAGRSNFLVIATGGGGGGAGSSTSGSTGNSTTFTPAGTGTALTSNGGSGGAYSGSTQSAANGGTSSGGQLNVTGGIGGQGYQGITAGGASFWGALGAGGRSAYANNAWTGGGGAGGTAIRVYNATEMGVTATYTVGTGGTAGSTGGVAGGGGVIFILEF